MAREIVSERQTKDFAPLIGLREVGQLVKGKVLEFGKTTNNNLVVTLELIDLTGSSTKSVSKGKYADVDVAPGDKVQLICTSKQLADKVPQVPVGDILTVRFDGKVRLQNGRSMNNFYVAAGE
jgi:hypothetical protein